MRFHFKNHPAFQKIASITTIFPTATAFFHPHLFTTPVKANTCPHQVAKPTTPHPLPPPSPQQPKNSNNPTLQLDTPKQKETH